MALWSLVGFWFFCFFCFFHWRVIGGSLWGVVVNKFIYGCIVIYYYSIFFLCFFHCYIWLLCNKIIFLMLFYCFIVCFHRLSYVFVWWSTYFFDEIYDFSFLGFFSVLGVSRLFSCFCFCQSCAFFIQSSAFFWQSCAIFIQSSAFFWQSCADFCKSSASYVYELSVDFACLCLFSFLEVSLGLKFVYLWGWHHCSLVCEYGLFGLLFYHFYTCNSIFSTVKW